MFIRHTGSVDKVTDTERKLSLGKNGETFGLSIFGDGFAVKDVFGGILNDYDSDGNGMIEGDELQALKSDLLTVAGDDNILDENELSLLFTKSENKTEASEKNSALFKAFVIALKNGIGNVKILGDEERRVISSVNDDGSGVVIRFWGDEGYRVEILGENGVKKELITSTNCDCREGKFPDKLQNYMTTHVIYNDDGTVAEQSCIYKGDNWTNPYTEHTLFEYDESGHLVSQIDKHNDLKSGNSTYTTTKFYENKNISQTIVVTNRNGLTSTEITDYAEDGQTVTGRRLKEEKEDVIIVEDYEGANIENRFQHLPSKRTVYDKATGAVKSVVTNTFNAEGVLTAKVVEDKVNNTTQEFDYTKPDGIIDTSSQGGIGNCFFLETVNALNTTNEGKKIINNMIEPHVTTDEQGNNHTSYKVKFAGIPQIISDLTSGIRNFPADKIFIKPEYEISEEEYKDACIRAGKDFSTGDKDVLLLELAYAKYRKDVAQTVSANNVDLSLFKDDSKLIAGLDVARGWNVNSEDMGSGGMIGVTMYLFTGKKSDVYFSPNQTQTICHIDSDGNLTAVEGSNSYWNTDLSSNESNVFNERYDDIDKVISILQKNVNKDGMFEDYIVEVSLPITKQIINGQEVTGANHAFTVKGIKNGKVILINPWDSSKEITISIEDFKSSANMINILDL